jgi:hypothetical protein
MKKVMTDKQIEGFARGRERGVLSRTLVPGEYCKKVQFSLSSLDLASIERFMEDEGIPNRSEALRQLLKRAGYGS